VVSELRLKSREEEGRGRSKWVSQSAEGSGTATSREVGSV